jgi:hypothetical protein
VTTTAEERVPMARLRAGGAIPARIFRDADYIAGRFERGDLVSVSGRVERFRCIAGHRGSDTLPGRRFGSPEALALYRRNALDASVKGALEHGLPQ